MCNQKIAKTGNFMSQIEIILNMLRPVVASLSVSERSELLAEVAKLLETKDNQAVSSGQTQSNTLSGVTFSGGNNALSFSPLQNQGGSLNLSPMITQTSSQNNELTEEALEKLRQLKELINQDKNLNLLVKEGVKQEIKNLQEALQKIKPDQGFIGQTVSKLKQGLEGVITLSEPTMKVVTLVCKLYGIPLP
ncbi:MAG: hypothetical protein QNJ46_27605 [Leptolyngbyaceae cyanobacterium MO_188.B28]|nr:hypothetical protein [Leptolyngbyaceae cyanobacterium MO_188.B28]